MEHPQQNMSGPWGSESVSVDSFWLICRPRRKKELKTVSFYSRKVAADGIGPAATRMARAAPGQRPPIHQVDLFVLPRTDPPPRRGLRLSSLILSSPTQGPEGRRPQKTFTPCLRKERRRQQNKMLAISAVASSAFAPPLVAMPVAPRTFSPVMQVGDTPCPTPALPCHATGSGVDAPRGPEAPFSGSCLPLCPAGLTDRRAWPNLRRRNRRPSPSSRSRLRSTVRAR
jgi:hypothetical protein